jgi:hypothetical protein
MKRFVSILLLALCAMPLAAADPAPTAAPTDNTVVTVYYFHRVNRCAGCRHAEAVTTEALKEHFAAEMEKGTVKFASVAVDSKDEGEKVLAESFDAFGPSLFLEVKKDGKTEKVALDKMWDMIGKGDPAYKTWVAESVRKHL